MSCERELVAQAARGDETAVITLYEQNKTAVFTYVYYRVRGDQSLAEEITAEVFTRMVARLPHFVYRERPLLAWLYTVARNCITDHFRRNGHFTGLPLSEQYPDETSNPEQHSHLELKSDHEQT